MSSITPWARRTPDKVACHFTDSGATRTYVELETRAIQAARWLIGLGLEAGDCVALLLGNHPAVFEVAFAAELAGLYYVPISTHLRRAEVAYILGDCGAKVIVTASDALAMVPNVPGLVVATVDVVEGTVDYEATVVGQSLVPLPARPVGRDLMYSSGTTGQPKGVLRPLVPAAERDVVRPVPAVLAAFAPDEATVYLSTGPLYHAAPHRFTVHTLRSGGTCIVPRRFDAEGALALIEQYRVTHSQWVPTMFVRLLALPEATRSRYDLGSLRRAIHAAAPCPAHVKDQMIAWWGPVVAEYYAGSETVGATWIESEDWLAHRGSVGRSISGTIHIVDEDGRELPAGEIGQIWFSGLPPFEYLNAPEKTRAAINAQGWGTYGDIGHLDEHGYLYLSDRRVDLILSGGVNIYPQEIEDVLGHHPAVVDAAVIGVADPEFGERVHAVVQLRAGSDVPAAELVAFCRERLASPKCPRAIDFIDRVPRSDIGKLLRRVVRDRYRPVAPAHAPVSGAATLD